MISDLTIISALLASILVLVGASGALLWHEARVRDLETRVIQTTSDESPQPNLFAGFTGLIRLFGESTRRFYSTSNLEHLRSVIQAAGYNPHRTLPMVLGTKAAMMILSPVLALSAALLVLQNPSIRIFVVGAGIVIGILGPELALRIVRRRFTSNIERGTPDALDLLVVCSEAGMGLESALERVSQEMRHSNPAVASVLSGFLNDLRVMPNQRDAFANLGLRAGTAGMRRFGVMLGQSLQYGTSVGTALRAVSSELRRERMNQLEERAVKLPAKLIFPLILFILPCLWIVLLGASLLHLSDSLGGITQNVQHSTK